MAAFGTTGINVTAPVASRSGDVEFRNAILAAMEPGEQDELRPLLSRQHLRSRRTLIEPNTAIRQVFFLESGVASVISRCQRRSRPIEVCMVGRLGFVGVPALLGTFRTPFRSIMLIPGVGLRMEAGEFVRAAERLQGLRRMLLAYVQASMVQQAQVLVCNTRHDVRQRVVRWILTSGDRLDSHHLPVTHDLLSRMLGVRRATITLVVSELEKLGVIEKARGQIVVQDRAALERMACECYRIIRSEYERVTAGLSH